jgi:4-amino-4-deoxy-L-arabinose transferase-like glycosyltransferase
LITPRGTALLQRCWPIAALAAVAAIESLVAHRVLFPSYSWNRDEPVYLWHVEVLRSGHLTSTDGGWPAFFHPWLSAAKDGELFSQYTLGWPIVLLAADVVFGSPAAAIAVGAALAVLGTYAVAMELTRDRRLSLLACAVLLASPILAVQGGAYLSYLFTLGLGLLFGAALLSGTRLRRPGRLVGAGLLLGWIFMTRPYDAVLWGGAFGAYAVIVHWKERAPLLRWALWLAVGAMPLIALTLAYNRRVTGSLTQFPILVADPLDTFGFGFRRLMPTYPKVEYGPRSAGIALLKNSALLPVFLAGNIVGIAAAGAGLWLGRRQRSTIALLLVATAFPVGYIVFWGMHISSLAARFGGPIYFVPLYAPLCVLIATTILWAWDRQRAQGIALAAVLVLATLPAAYSRFDVNRRISEAQLPWKHATDSIEGRALVFVAHSGPYLMALDPYASNGPALDDRVLYANDLGARNLDLIAAMHDRTPYLERSNLTAEDLAPREHPRTPSVSITPLRVVSGDHVSLSARATNVTGAAHIEIFLLIDGNVQWRSISADATRGATYSTTWALDATALARRRGTVTMGVGFGSSAEEAQLHAVESQAFHYRVTGGAVEVLAPGTKTLAGSTNGKLTSREVDHLPGLDVALAAS